MISPKEKKDYVKCSSCRRRFPRYLNANAYEQRMILKHAKGRVGYHCPSDGLWFPSREAHRIGCVHCYD